MTLESIAIIGFGEVGSIFARDLRAAGVARIAAFDIAFAAARQPAVAAARDAARAVCASAAEAAARPIWSSVPSPPEPRWTPRAAAADGLRHAPFFLDVNSVSPGTKQEAAPSVEAAGGRYVEAAVMTSVPPHGIRSPMLLGGPHAATFVEPAAPSACGSPPSRRRSAPPRR